MYLSVRNSRFKRMFSHTNHFILIILYSLTIVSCDNPSLNGFVKINDNNDQMQEESSSYLHFARIPDEDDARKILLQMGNQSVYTNSDDLDLSASANMAQILTNVNDNEQRNLQQQLQTNEDPLSPILPRVKFDCKNRKEGYYSDPDFNCEVFHFCKLNGERFTLVCPIKMRYSVKAMTCVYEDNKLYECPGLETTTNSSTQTINASQITILQNSTKEADKFKLNDETTTNSSIQDKNGSIVQLIETNKMSTWNDIINRGNKYVNNPTQLNNNDIMESLNQITTTLSSTKLNDEITNLNNNSDASDGSTSLSFGTRFNSGNLNSSGNNSIGKNRTNSVKKITGNNYEDLFTKYQKRKKYKTTTTSTTTSTNSLDSSESSNLSSGVNYNGETESSENNVYTTQSSSLASLLNATGDKTMYQPTNEQNSSDQLFSSSSNINDQSNNDNNQHLNHHTDYKEINDQSYQYASYQTSNEDSVQPIKIGQMIGNHQNSNLSTTTNTFNNQYDNQFDKSTSTDSGFKPIFMQTIPHLHQNTGKNKGDIKPSSIVNQFKFVNSKLSIMGGKDQFDMNDNTISAPSTSNPVLFTGNKNSTTIINNEFNQLSNDDQQDKSNQTTLSNDLIKNDSGYQTRENYRLKVKDVSEQKLKDFIKNNDLIDLSSTAISINTATNSPSSIQIVPQILKEKRSRNKNEILLPSSSSTFKSTNYGRQNTTKIQFNGNSNNISNWPKNGFQNDKTPSPPSLQSAQQNYQHPQFVSNYWPYLNNLNGNNLNYQNLNKQYNSYNLDNLINDDAYKYDYVFGLSKVLPSINSNFPPFLPDKNFMLKYPSLFSDYYTPIDLQLFNSKLQAQKKISPPNQVDKNDQPSTTTSPLLPNWFKSKFSLKSPINRNTNSNTNANANTNGVFSNTNNFLHSAASSSFNYPLYELPPPALLKQQQQQQQSSLALVSPTASSVASNSQQQQLNNLLNSPQFNSQLLNSQLNNQNILLNNALLPTASPTQNQQQNSPNSNTRKTFFSQLSRLFSSASMPIVTIARPVRVPYSAANIASAFSSLTQPFSKLQIDNLSNQLFSPIKGLLNATTAYMPIRKENPILSSSSNKNNHNDANSEEDLELDELEKQILNANGISQYSLNPQSTVNQPIAQQTSNLGHHTNSQLQNPLNFNAFNIHSNQMSQIPFYGHTPIKRSSNLQHHLASLKHYQQPKVLYNNLKVRSVMSNKPTYEKQQTTNEQFSQLSPQFLADRHDMMDDYILKNYDYFYDLKRSKRRKKRNIAFSDSPMHAFNYSPKYTFPFLAPYISSSFSSPSLPATTYLHNHPTFFASHHQIPNHPTPVLPPILPIQFATMNLPAADKPTKLSAGESQFNPQIVGSIASTSTQSAHSSASSGLNSKSISSTSSSSTNTPSTFGSLSLASAASQLAVSLANISKTHKNTKIRKHLSKLASSSNLMLPSITNLTSSINTSDDNSNNNKTISKDHKATATIWQRPPGKSTFTTWSFSAIPTGSKDYALPFEDFPFFSNQYNNPLRNLPAHFATESKSISTIHHPFNSHYSSIDLNPFSYQILPVNNYPLTQLPKLHIQYQPANTLATTNTILKTSTGNNLKSKDDIDENYGRRKTAITTSASANEFRDLLNVYKQKNTNPYSIVDNKELYMPFKSIYSTVDESKEGQKGSNQQQQYSPDFGFPSKAIIFKSTTDFKESGSGFIKAEDSTQKPNYKQQDPQITNNKATSKYQSQSTNNRLVKQKLSSTPKTYSSSRFTGVHIDAPKYKDGEIDLLSQNKVRKYSGKASNNFDEDLLEDEKNDFNIHQTSSKKSNHLHGQKLEKANLNDYYEKPSRSTGFYSNNNPKNRNLKLYGNNNKKYDFLDNYHETDDEDAFFKSSPNFSNMRDQDSSKAVSNGRQLVNGKNLDQNFKINSKDFEDDFFNEQTDSINQNLPTPNKQFKSKNSHKTMIKHSTVNRLNNHHQSITPKSSRKLTRPSLVLKYEKKANEPIDDQHSGSVDNLDATNYEINPETHQLDNKHENNFYSNKNQLNFRTTSNDEKATLSPKSRSVLVKTSSYSFEIPNHSVNEEVEFDNDHIVKQHKMRPSYTLEQAARKSFLTIPLQSANPLIYSPTGYDLKAPTKFNISPAQPSSSRSKIDYPLFNTEKQKQYSPTIEEKNLKSNLDDDSFNQFEIRRQPNMFSSNRHQNHHLPHSHIEDVEAFYKAKKQPTSKAKFRQFFHQQELRHNENLPANTMSPIGYTINGNLFNDQSIKYKDTNVNLKSSSSKTDDVKNDQPTQKESSSKSKNDKPQKIYFNWQSKIDHSMKQPSVETKSNLKILEETDNPSEDESDRNQNSLTKLDDHKNLKNNFNLKNNPNDSNHNINLPPFMNGANPIKPMNNGFNSKNRSMINNFNDKQPMYTPLNQDEDWFKQDWVFKDIKDLNQQLPDQAPVLEENLPPMKIPIEQNLKQNINNQNVNNLENNNDIDFNSGDTEYEDDANSIPPVNSNRPVINQPHRENQINLKTKKQVMDQQNRQYHPKTTTTSTTTTTSSPPSQTDQTSSSLPISNYKTKFLSSHKFAERQKYKNSLTKTTTKSPPITTTSRPTTSSISTKEQTIKKYEKTKKDFSSIPKKSAETTRAPFTRTTMRQQNNDKQNQDKNDKQLEKSTIKQKNDQMGKIMDMQNSSTTIDAQILDKLPISIDSIFDTIDEENSNNDYETMNSDQQNNKQQNSLQNKKGDLPAVRDQKDDLNENLDNNLNESNENSSNDDLTTNLTSGEQFGARLISGRLQPKVSIKASYSSVSSTVPRAMAQKMDAQKVESVGYKTLNSDDLNLKKESNGLLKNRMKQFKKQTWLSSLTNQQTKNSISTTTTTSSPPSTTTTKQESIDQDSKDQKSWKGFINQRQQKVIEHKKNLDDKSNIMKKHISPYLSKFRKETKKDNEKDHTDDQMKDKVKESNKLNENETKEITSTTTLKSTSTTVPTTTSKSISFERINPKFNQDKSNDKFKSLNRFRTANNKSEPSKALNNTVSIVTNSTVLSNLSNRIDQNKSLKTNYNLNFNSNTTLISQSTNLNQDLNQNNSTNNSVINSLSTEQAKPYRRVFSAMAGGTIVSKSKN